MRDSVRGVVLGAMVVFLSVGAAGVSAQALPMLSVVPLSGAPGTTVRVTGSDFPVRAAVTFTWDGRSAHAPGTRTGRTGRFEVSLVLPRLSAGNHVLRASAGGASASTTVQIGLPPPSPTPTATPVATATDTPVPTATDTPAPAATDTPVPAATDTPAPTSTATATPTSTGTPTATSTTMPTPTAAASVTPVTGAPTIAGCPTLPSDNIWNARIDGLPVSSFSANYLASMGATSGLHPDFGTVYNGAPNGIPFVVVPGTQPRVPVSFTYADESDPGPYPIPTNAPIEGGPTSNGDRHVLVVDSGACTLYELYAAVPQPDGSWTAGSGAVFPLTSDALRPATWTSADAAGLPILPGLVRYDEVSAGQIAHALRFTAAITQRAYVWPARHDASSNTSPQVPPMGTRVRLKASVDISHFSAANQIILQALKTYGMILADNGSNWFISGAPDPRWNDSDLGTLRQIVGGNFEVVDSSSLQIDPNSGQARAH